MLSRFSLLIVILLGYVYFISHDSDKTLYKKAKTTCTKYYKDFQQGDLKVKVTKPSIKEKRFF
jgi:hypothetical protein